jgi:hypothetical protein
VGPGRHDRQQKGGPASEGIESRDRNGEPMTKFVSLSTGVRIEYWSKARPTACP